MNENKEMLRIPLPGLLIAVSFFLSGCTSMPLTTMYKLHRMDPMDADPAQIKVAIRADERIGIRKGGAKIELKFDAEDGTLNIDETFIIEIIRNPSISAELVEDKNPGESVTVLRLTESDAQRLKLLQSSLAPYREEGRKGSASLGVRLNGVCLHSRMPAGQVLVDIFLQTSDYDGFFVFARNLDLRKKSEQGDANLDSWPNCQETQTG
jgi:hypothetical protein